MNHRLDEAGLLAWIDREDLKVGKHWRPSLVKAIDSSLATLVVITPGALASDYVMREWMRAEAQNKDVIPLMFAEIPADHMDRAIFDLQCLDFKSPAESDWDELIERLRQIEAKKSVDPEVARAEAILKSAETDKWEGALKFLEICTHESATEALVRVINGHLPEIAARAAFALNVRTGYTDMRALIGLAEGLKLGENIRNRAIQQLEKQDTAEAVECLDNYWTVSLNRSHNESDVIMAFTRMKAPNVEPILRGLLEDDNLLGLHKVIEAIGQFPNENLVPRLTHFMDNGSQYVRQASYYLLAKIGGQAAVNALLGRLKMQVKEAGKLPREKRAFPFTPYFTDDIQALVNCFTDEMLRDITSEQKAMVKTAFWITSRTLPESLRRAPGEDYDTIAPPTKGPEDYGNIVRPTRR